MSFIPPHLPSVPVDVTDPRQLKTFLTQLIVILEELLRKLKVELG